MSYSLSSQKTEIIILLYSENRLIANDDIMIVQMRVTIMYESFFL